MNDKLYNLRKSFVYAFGGIAFCVRYERNMRIHIVATAFVMFMALCFYELSRAELLVLILTCAVVMSLEMLNTAIEVLTDKASPGYSALAKAAKDAAAGAVLTASFAAVVIGVLLFWDVGTFREIVAFFTGNVFAAIAFVIWSVIGCVFIFTGKERRKRGKKRDKFEKN